jgi:hypothetical protein
MGREVRKKGSQVYKIVSDQVKPDTFPISLSVYYYPSIPYHCSEPNNECSFCIFTYISASKAEDEAEAEVGAEDVELWSSPSMYRSYSIAWLGLPSFHHSFEKMKRKKERNGREGEDGPNNNANIMPYHAMLCREEISLFSILHSTPPR